MRCTTADDWTGVTTGTGTFTGEPGVPRLPRLSRVPLKVSEVYTDPEAGTTKCRFRIAPIGKD